MLDCPEQIQTSPTRTLVSFTSFGPETVSSYGPPAGNGPSFAIHFPSAPDAAVAVLTFIATVIFCPGSAQPQTGSGTSRWSTMSLEKSGCRNGLAGASAARATGASSRTAVKGNRMDRIARTGESSIGGLLAAEHTGARGG